MANTILKMLLVLILIIGSRLTAQDQVDLKANPIISYSFIIKDNPAKLFTMRQFNENYLSLYRFGAQKLDNAAGEKISSLIQIGLLGFFFIL